VARRDLTSDRWVVIGTLRSELPATLVARVAHPDNYKYREVFDRLPRAPRSSVLLEDLNVTAARWFWAVMIALSIPLAIMLWYTLRGLLNPLRAGPIAGLRKSVRAGEGLPALVAEIDQQLAGRAPDARRHGPIMLPSWLIINAVPFFFAVIAASDVIWAAPAEIATVKRRRLAKNMITVVTRSGQKYSITAGLRRQEWLANFHRWAPWAAIGADETMQANFGPGALGSGPQSKARAVAMIDRRREDILTGRVARPPGPPDAPAQGRSSAPRP